MDAMLLVRARTSLCALPLHQVVETMRPLKVRPHSGVPALSLGVLDSELLALLNASCIVPNEGLETLFSHECPP